ncbi:MAG: DUF4197 domain-containing protein [Bacteroidota bacterium]
MYRTTILTLIAIFSYSFAQAQLFQKIKKEVEKELPISNTSELTQDDAAMGLKEALTIGIKKGVETVSKPDGYFKDPIIKILMPDEAKAVESKLRAIGQDKLVDDAIEAMNRAAEDAASGALDLFVTAIKNLTIEDALAILGGEEDAATQYLDRQTRNPLTEKFQPVIKSSLDKVNATKHWNAVFTAYNKIPFIKKVNPDLEAFVTEKAIDGLFVQIAKEEKEIRENPAARVTDILQKVFGN